jgi:hypothetical protein
MRKFSIVALAVLLVAVFAVSSFAAETTFSGSYRVRSVWDYNMEKSTYNDVSGTHYRDVSTRYFDQRFQLLIEHTQSEFLKAGVRIDIYEDVWGQGRAGRMNTADGGVDGGEITGAWLEFITPIGQFKVGRCPGSSFGPGLWSDGDTGGNPDDNISWAAKFDLANGAFIFTSLTYTKYRDEVNDWLAETAGFDVEAWPGRPVDSFGGAASEYYNQDLNAYTFAMGYISDNIRAGALFSWFDEPSTIGGAYLIKHIPGFAHASGEAAHGWNTDTTNPFSAAYEATTAFVGTFALPYAAWPISADTTTGNMGTLATLYGIAGTQFPYTQGFGRAGLYNTDLMLFDVWVQLDFLDDMIQFEAEFYKAWGACTITGWGNAYNSYLDGFNGTASAVYVPPPVNAVLPQTLSGVPTGARLPSRIGVDGYGFYADLTFDFDVFNVGVSFLMVDGNKHYSGLTQDNFVFITTGGFDTFEWGNIIAGWDRHFTAGSIDGGLTAPLGLSKNPENVTSIKLHWSVCPFDTLDIHGAFIWAKYTYEVGRYAVDATGTPVNNWNAYYMHPMNYFDGPNGNYYIPAELSDDLGWEIDVGVTWAIMEGLTFNSEFGVFFPGDAFDYREPTTLERQEWDEIYRWTNSLTYEF